MIFSSKPLEVNVMEQRRTKELQLDYIWNVFIFIFSNKKKAVVYKLFEKNHLHVINNLHIGHDKSISLF